MTSYFNAYGQKVFQLPARVHSEPAGGVSIVNAWTTGDPYYYATLTLQNVYNAAYYWVAKSSDHTVVLGSGQQSGSGDTPGVDIAITQVPATEVNMACFVRERKYGVFLDNTVVSTLKQFLGGNAYLAAAGTNYNVANAATAAGYTGYAINDGTSTITITGTLTIQELYDAVCYNRCQSAQMDKSIFLTTVDGTNFISTFNIVINSGGIIDTTGKAITLSGGATLTINGGTYQDRNGVQWVAGGSHYYAAQFTHTLVNSGTLAAIPNAVVAYMDSNGVDQTYNTSFVNGGVLTDGSGIATGYAVWKIDASTKSLTSIFGEYGYNWSNIPTSVSGATITSTIYMSPDTNIVDSKATALAVSGVVTVEAAKTCNCGANSLFLSMENLKARQASTSVIDSGIKGYQSYWTIYNYSDSGLILRDSGGSYYGAYGWAVTNFTGYPLYNRDAGGTITSSSTAIVINSIVAGSRVQIYNTDDSTELYNDIVAGTSLTLTYSWTANKAIRFRIKYTDSSSAYLMYESTGTVLSTGLAINANQILDTVYATNGIDGSTVTECSISGATVRIYVDDTNNVTNFQRIYNWYQYILFTSIGIADQSSTYFFATDPVRYKYDPIMKVYNQKADVLVIKGADVSASDGSDEPFADYTGGSIQIQTPEVADASGSLAGIKNNTSLIPGLF